MAKKNKKPKVRPGAWFVPVRGSYLPASPMGWWTYVPFVGYLIFSLVFGINETSSKYVAVLFIAANWLFATVLMTYVAAKKS